MSQSDEGIIRRLIERQALDRIEIVSSDGKTFTAIAYPAGWHRAVAMRRKAAFNAAGKSEFSITEAQAIADKAVSDALCRASALTIARAIADLAGELAKLAKALAKLPEEAT